MEVVATMGAYNTTVSRWPVDDVTGSAGGEETRPVNTTIRVWEKVSDYDE